MNRTLTTIFGLTVACATGFAGAQEVKGDAQAGEKKVAMCIGCHGIPGYQASFPEVHKVPMISGQGGKYIAAALDAAHTYVGGVMLHGKPLDRAFITHQELMAGGELRFAMQAMPNRDWPGVGAKAPYSMSNE